MLKKRIIMWEAVYCIPIPDKQRIPGSFHPLQKVQLQIEKRMGAGKVALCRRLKFSKKRACLIWWWEKWQFCKYFVGFFVCFNNDHISQIVLREKEPFLLRSYHNFAVTLGLELPGIWGLWNPAEIIYQNLKLYC